MSGVLKKACWLLPVLFVVSPVLAQQGGGIQSAANIESHISFMSVFRGLLGIVSLLAIAWLFSKDRKAISWKVVGIGLAMQLVLAVGILYVPAGTGFHPSLNFSVRSLSVFSTLRGMEVFSCWGI